MNSATIATIKLTIPTSTIINKNPTNDICELLIVFGLVILNTAKRYPPIMITI